VAKARRKFHGIQAASRAQAFVTAAAKSNFTAMRRLLADGLDINAQSSGDSALHVAARTGRLRTAAFLIAKGADLDRFDKYRMTPLMSACVNGEVKGSQVALMLLRAGADATIVRPSDEMTALKFATKRCGPEVIRALIDAGAEVDGPPGTKQTALMLAARANNVKAIEVLVKHGADLSLTCQLPWGEGQTAEGLAELERQRAALDCLRQLRERKRC
jgi:ankyrin repeat protein